MATYLASPRSAYQTTAALTASPGQLVVMLYDGAHRFLTQAAAAMRARNVELTHTKLRRAEMIIHHLRSTLDFDRGGEISPRLAALYDFWLRHLNAARLAQDADRVEEVDRLLMELREAWAAIAHE